MLENIEEEAWNLLKKFKRITPIFIIRKFSVNGETARKICNKIWLRQHLEARKIAKEIEGI